MKAALLASVFAVLLASSAFADGYQDFNAGAAAFTHDDLDGAQRYFSAALADPDLPAHLRATAYLARADLYAKQNKFGLAISDYTAAIAAHPDWPDPYIERCDLYARQIMLDKALSDCSSAIALQPDNLVLRRMRIDLYYCTKDYGDIVADYSVVIAQHPDVAALLLDRSNALIFMGKYDQASADADAAHDLDRHWSRPYIMRGWIYFAQAEFGKAEDEFDTAVDRSSDYAGAYVARGEAQWAEGKFAEADDSFNEAFAHDKTSLDAFLFLSIERSLTGKAVPSEISDRFAAANLTDSTDGAIAQLYLGKLKPEALTVLHGYDQHALEDVQCDIGFYVGEWFRMKGDLAAAKRELEISLGACAVNSPDHQYPLVALSQLH